MRFGRCKFSSVCIIVSYRLTRIKRPGRSDSSVDTMTMQHSQYQIQTSACAAKSHSTIKNCYFNTTGYLLCIAFVLSALRYFRRKSNWTRQVHYLTRPLSLQLGTKFNLNFIINIQHMSTVPHLQNRVLCRVSKSKKSKTSEKSKIQENDCQVPHLCASHRDGRMQLSLKVSSNQCARCAVIS